MNLKPVLITTSHKGVFFAEVSPDTDLTARTLTDLKNCKMAIYWGTTKGIHQLCETGPTSTSKISAIAGIHVLHDITAVFEISKKAQEAWLKS